MRTRLSSKQIKFLDELFCGKKMLSEQEVLKRRKIKASEFQKWLKKEAFINELEARMAGQERQRRIIMNRNATTAAQRLSELINSEDPDISRKAWLDIAGRTPALDKSASNRQIDEVKEEEKEDGVKLTEEEAEKILAALAEEKPNIKN